MAKTKEEIHQEEIDEINKEVQKDQKESGIAYAYDPEALLAIKKRREAKKEALESKKVEKKEEKDARKDFQKSRK